MSNIKKIILNSLIIIFLFDFSYAAQMPDSGSLLNQNNQDMPNLDDIIIQEKAKNNNEENSAQTAKKTIYIKSIEVQGNSIIDQISLDNIIKKYENKDLTFSEISSIANQLTELYKQKGYFLAKAIIPVQKIENDKLIIQVLETKYDTVILDNQSKVKDSLLKKIIENLKEDELIEKTKLDNVLLLLSDIDGITTKSTFKTGSKYASSKLTIKVLDSKPFNVKSSVDNYGNQYTGIVNVKNQISIYNPLKNGDLVKLGFNSSGDKFNQGLFSYDTLINGKGSRIGFSSSAVKYKLGSIYAPIAAHGNGFLYRNWLNHPIIRQENINLNLGIALTRSILKDHIDATATKNDRIVDKATLSFSGNKSDNTFIKGVNYFNLSTDLGKVKFTNLAAQLTDQNNANTNGEFKKITLTIGRYQKITPKTSLHLNILSCFASKNLDTSEKLAAGDMSTVKAYNKSSISADQGHIINLELKHQLGKILNGTIEALPFVDLGYVKINNKSYGTTKNNTILRDAGIVLKWHGPNNWKAKFAISSIIGKKSSLSSNISNFSSFFEIEKSF